MSANWDSTIGEIIAEAIDNALAEPWPAIFAEVHQPTIMLHAPGPFGAPGAMPVVPPAEADTSTRRHIAV